MRLLSNRFKHEDNQHKLHRKKLMTELKFCQKAESYAKKERRAGRGSPVRDIREKASLKEKLKKTGKQFAVGLLAMACVLTGPGFLQLDTVWKKAGLEKEAKAASSGNYYCTECGEWLDSQGSHYYDCDNLYKTCKRCGERFYMRNDSHTCKCDKIKNKDSVSDTQYVEVDAEAYSGYCSQCNKNITATAFEYITRHYTYGGGVVTKHVKTCDGTHVKGYGGVYSCNKCGLTMPSEGNYKSALAGRNFVCFNELFVHNSQTNDSTTDGIPQLICDLGHLHSLTDFDTDSGPRHTCSILRAWVESKDGLVKCKDHSSVQIQDNGLPFYDIATHRITHSGNLKKKVSITYNNGGGASGPTSDFTYETGPMPTVSSVPSKSYSVTYNANGGDSVPASSHSCSFLGYYTSASGGTQYYNSSGAATASCNLSSDTTLYAQWQNPTVTLPTPTRTDYRFLGWKNGSTTYPGGQTVTLTGDLYLTAEWQSLRWPLSFNANGGTGAPADISLLLNNSATIPAGQPSRTGYTFGGWSTAPNGTAAYSSGSTIRPTVANTPSTLYAVWNAKNYTITLNSCGATSPGSPSIGATFDKAMPAITVPTKEKTITFDANGGSITPASKKYNVTFGGYYDSGGTQYITNTGASARAWDKDANITLEARWLPAHVNLPTPVRKGYTFMGWASSPGAVSGVTSADLTNDAHYYAAWQVNTYSITYAANGGKEGSKTQNAVFDADVTLKGSNTFTRDYYTFVNWNTAAGGSGTGYEAGQTFNWQYDHDISLYAQWTGNVYGYTFDDAGGTGGQTELWEKYSEGIFYDREHTRPAAKVNVPTKYGYDFVGYFNGDTKFVNADGTFAAEMSTTAIHGPTVLTAKWEAKEYKVSLDPGESGEGGPIELDVVFDEKVPDIGKVPVWTRSVTFDSNNGSGCPDVSKNREFLGFFYGDVKYIDAQGKGCHDWDIDVENPKLEAHWKNTSIELPSSERIGFTLVGWVDSDGNVNTGDYELRVDTQKLTAKWRRNQYKVTYNYQENGGDSVQTASKKFYYEEDVDLTNKASKQNWSFVGWSLYPDVQTDDGILESLQLPAEDITLYAIFSRQVEASFVSQDGKQSVKKKIYGDATHAMLEVPDASAGDAGWAFKGWSLKKEPDAAINAKAGETIKVYQGEEPVYYARFSYPVTASFITDSQRIEKTTDVQVNASDTGKIGKGSVTAPSSAEVEPKEGMKAKGWLKDLSDYVVDHELGSKIMLSEDSRFYLKSTKKVKASFKDCSLPEMTGEVLWNTVEQKNFNFILPEDEQEGYELESFSTGSGDDLEKGTPVSISSSEEYKANWKPVRYVISYDGNNASDGEMKDQTVEYDKIKRLEWNKYKKHYEVEIDPNGGKFKNAEDKNSVEITSDFLGWDSKAGISYADGECVKNLTNQEEVIKLKAKWSDGRLRIPDPARKGYEFLGWSDGTGDLFKGEYSPHTDTVLTAIWKPKNSSLVIDAGDANGGLPIHVEASTDENLPDLETIPVRKYTVIFDYDGLKPDESVTVEYNFKGIYSKPDGKGTQYYDESGKAVRKWDLSGSQKLYAAWEKNSITLPNPSWDGFNTDGWMLDGRLLIGEYFPDKDVTLKLKRSSKVYAIMLDTNGGAMNSMPTHYTFGSEFTFDSPRLDGYVFIGWYGSNGRRVNGVTKDMTGNLSLTAKWSSVKDKGSLAGNEDVTGVEIPDGTEEIGDKYFQGCTNLVEVKIPDSVNKIGDNAFDGCNKIVNIVLPDSIKEIGKEAFKDCTNLAEIKIPSNVQSVGKDAFKGCDSLQKITFYNPSCKIYDSATTIPKDTVIYGYEPSTAKEYAEKWGRKFVSLGESCEIRFKANKESVVISRTLYVAKGARLPESVKVPIVITNKNAAFTGYFSDDFEGMLYDSNGKRASDAAVTKDVTLWAEWESANSMQADRKTYSPSTIKSGKYSFSFNSDGTVSLKAVSSKTKSARIPKSVKIGGRSYAVSSIEKNAFKDAKGISSVTVPENVEAIRNGAFSGAAELKKIKLEGNGLKAVGPEAFKNTRKRLKIIVTETAKKRYRDLLRGKGNNTLVI
jgi:Listeria/Bacterioides repeat